MSESDKPQGQSVQPPTVPIKGVNVPDPTKGSAAGGEGSSDGSTGHEAFEKAKAGTAARNRADDVDKAAEDGLA